MTKMEHILLAISRESKGSNQSLNLCVQERVLDLISSDMAEECVVLRLSVLDCLILLYVCSCQEK